MANNTKRINEKQRAYAKQMANGNYKSRRKAAEKAGYSPSTARTPSRIEKSRGYIKVLAEEATKVGNIIDAMGARLADEDWSQHEASEVVEMLSKMAQAQKNIMSSLPKVDNKPHDIGYVIDLD